MALPGSELAAQGPGAGRASQHDHPLALRDGRAPVERTAVVDCGSNTFRMVVFSSAPGVWWRRSDELYDAVRIGAGLDETGSLQPDAMARALRTLTLYEHFARATGLPRRRIQAVATSAIRDAANRGRFLRDVRAETGIDVRVLSVAEEARYGYLAAVNSTTLEDGVVLDLGGGSLQLVDVRGRLEHASASWALGAVRMSERFLPSERAGKRQLKSLRAHVRETLASAPWLGGAAGGRIVGIGGTVRNLAAAAQRAAQLELPSFGVQGFVLGRAQLDDLVDQLAALPASRRGSLPGIKPERGDVILAGAVVIQVVLELAGVDGVEATEAGLREGVFFETHLGDRDPPLFRSVRAASVRNLAAQYEADPTHPDHVAGLALETFDGLAAAGLHPGDPEERELLWAAAELHDIGVAVDYDDHHRHTRYLILNAGLPGFSPREVALIAQMARYHRKGEPSLGDLAPLTVGGDEERLARGAAILRVAEQLERGRDQLVREVRVETEGDDVILELVAEGDASLARWSAERQGDVFAAAFGRPLRLR